jgi:hypothetical protein
MSDSQKQSFIQLTQKQNHGIGGELDKTCNRSDEKGARSFATALIHSLQLNL